MAPGPAPLVNVGLPVFNGARFLPRAVDSILGQTLGDLELLIADNASTDDTESIARRYAQRDGRVRYVRHLENRGAYFNWNFVARTATGRYFKWASANDYCAPTMLARCVDALESDPSLVLCHGRTCVLDDAGNEEGVYAADIELLEERPSARFRRICRELALNNAQCGVIRVDALKRTGYDRPYPAGDLVLMAELALIGKYRLLPEVLLFRRLGPQSTTRNMSAADARRFFDPASTTSHDTRTWRRHLDYVATVARARINLSEKLRCLMLVARHAYWDKSRLWREIMRRGTVT
jgi:glycosyltransferase involved in cell wall biosynthesis